MLEAPALTGATSQSWCALRGATALPAHHRPVQWLVRAEDVRLDAAAVSREGRAEAARRIDEAHRLLDEVSNMLSDVRRELLGRR